MIKENVKQLCSYRKDEGHDILYLDKLLWYVLNSSPLELG